MWFVTGDVVVRSVSSPPGRPNDTATHHIPTVAPRPPPVHQLVVGAVMALGAGAGEAAAARPSVQVRERTLTTALGQPQHCAWNDVKRAGTGDVSPVKCPSVACCRIDACTVGNDSQSATAGPAADAAASAELAGGDATANTQRKRSTAAADMPTVPPLPVRQQQCVRLDVRLVASDASKALLNVSLGVEELCFEAPAATDDDGQDGFGGSGDAVVTTRQRSDWPDDGGNRTSGGGADSVLAAGGGSVQLVFGVPVSRYTSIDAFDVVLR